jgi:Tfp pilus assembly pilus retraction ATPase PilT
MELTMALIYLCTGPDGCGKTVTQAEITQHIKHHKLTQAGPTVLLIPRR